MKDMRRLACVLMLLVVAVTMQGQMLEPVHFKSELKTAEGSSEGEIVFSATIDAGWHVYSTDLGEAGPISATFNAVKMEGVETVGKLTPKGNIVKKYDEMFGMELKFFENKATFVQKVRFTKPEYTIDCYLEYGACNDQNCLPPTQVELKKSGTSPIPSQGGDVEMPNKRASQDSISADIITSKDSVAADTAASANQTSPPLEGLGEAWYPVFFNIAASSPCFCMFTGTS